MIVAWWGEEVFRKKDLISDRDVPDSGFYQIFTGFAVQILDPGITVGHLEPVTFLGFHKGGLFFLWPLMLSQRGTKLCFPIFSYGQNWFFFWSKGGHGPIALLGYTTA